MKFQLSTYQNNYSKIIKYSALVILIFILSFKATSEIPEKYKIESSLSNCKGTDYRKWNNCYGEYKFPRIEYKGEWKNGAFDGQGILREAWGDIYFGGFKDNKADGYGRQDFFESGGYFEGEVKNDYLNGKGTYLSANGCKREGTFKDHDLHGEGKVTCEGGYYSEGTYKKDILNGEGKIIFANGTKYIGSFKDGDLNGKGRIEWNNGSIEFGNFINDELNGKGTYLYSGGNKYVGDFVNGIRTGKGTFTWVNGDRYEGDFVDGKLSGKGTTYYIDGEKHEGQYQNGEFDGKGTYTSETGNKYIGNFLDGNKSGYGVFTWSDGEKYTGQWKNNTFHKGEYHYANGNKYIGPYKDGLEHGYGFFTWSDGDKYEGDFELGFRTGKGKYIYESGTVYEGDFIENFADGKGAIIYSSGDKYIGEFKDGDENGQGSAEYADGRIYRGQFKDGYRHGQGKMVYANGDIYDGLWEDGGEAEGKTTLAKHTTEEKYYALIIGNNDYEKLEDLDNAVNDAKDLEKVLKDKYGFETTLMIDKNKDDTHNAIINFTQKRKKSDNILIYYAGHGQLIKKQKRGYWLPTDAGSTQDSKWLSNNSIKDLIGSSDAKHILLIVDSCFSGSLMRGSGENKSVEKITATSIKRYQQKKTRLVMTSGGNEQVVDGIGNSKNSVFAEPLIKSLRDNNKVIRSIELFQEVRNYVENNADQTPEHSLIHGTGHDGGEFLFFPKS